MKIQITKDDGNIIESETFILSNLSENYDDNIISLNNVSGHFAMLTLTWLLEKEIILETINKCDCTICSMFVNELNKFIKNLIKQGDT